MQRIEQLSEDFADFFLAKIEKKSGKISRTRNHTSLVN